MCLLELALTHSCAPPSSPSPSVGYSFTSVLIVGPCQLLGRVFSILHENNPELAGDRPRTAMRPLQVLCIGTKKTIFANFMDLCKTVHRQPEHVIKYLESEMGTTRDLDGQQRLVVKGRFAPINFEGILRRYVIMYLHYVVMNMSFAMDVRVQTLLLQKKIVFPSLDVNRSYSQLHCHISIRMRTKLQTNEDLHIA